MANNPLKDLDQMTASMSSFMNFLLSNVDKSKVSEAGAKDLEKAKKNIDKALSELRKQTTELNKTL